MTKAKTVPQHPQADDLQERWLQLAFKVKRSEFSQRAPAMVRAAKQFHGNRATLTETQRHASLIKSSADKLTGASWIRHGGACV